MPRRSRTRGASGSSKTKRPPVATPEAHREFETLLDEVFDALMSRDRERMRSVLGELAMVPSFAPEVITRRMIEGRERAPGIVLAILRDITQERTPVYLRRIIKARDVPDPVRYEAQRMLGFGDPREHKRRVGFLKTLDDPYGALAHSAEAAGTIWPTRVEVLSEVAAYLRALDPPARYEALDRVLHDIGWNAIPLLHGLLHADDPVVQLRAIDALAGHRFSASPGPLRRLAASARNEEVRRRVEDALRDIAFDGDSSPDGEESQFPNAGLYPFGWARVKRVDPDGRQSLWVTREIGEGVYEGTNIYVHGASGLDEINRIERLPLEMLEEDILAIEGDIAPWTTVDLPAARGLVELAVERYVAMGRVFPFEFELYEPMFHDTYPPAPDEAVVTPTLDDAAFAGRTDLLEHSVELLDHPLFNEWALDFEHVLMALALKPPPGPEVSDDDVQRSLASQLLDAPTRLLLSDSLRRQAWLLDAAGNDDERDLALALAAWLPDASDDDLAANGFVAGMIQISLGVSAGILGAGGYLPDVDDLEDDWLLDDEDIAASAAGDPDAIEASWTPAPLSDRETDASEHPDSGGVADG